MGVNKVVGSSLPRVEGYAKVTGACLYAADYQRPGTLWGKVLHSPLPHARILNVDTSKARSIPGVKGVVIADDISPRLVGATLRDMPILAKDRVRFVGEEIAAVAAVDKDVAEEAIGLIEVDYEEMPTVFESLEAMRPDAPILHPEYVSYEGPRTKAPDLHNVQTLVRGGKADIDQGFRESDQIFENTFRVQMVHQGYIEPYACTVEVDAESRVAVWVCNQAFFKLRKVLAQYLGIEEKAITIYPSNMGGSFGAKDFLTYVPVAYYLSRMTGKPVKFVKSYAEELTASCPRHPAVVTLRTGVKKDGTLWAWEGKTFYNGGAYGAYKPNPEGSMSGAYMVAGSYRIPHTRLEGYCVYTNQVPCGYFRAPGETQTLFAVESHMDVMAEALGLDPLEFRQRNALSEGDTRATGEPLRDPHAVDVLRRVAQISKWKPSKVGVKKNGYLLGRGISLGDRHVGSGESSFELFLEKDGSLRLVSGVGDQGVGAYTMHRQVVSETLQVDPNRVQIEVRDTSTAPYDQGIKGARGTHIEGIASQFAANSLMEKLCELAASSWKVRPDEVGWSKGGVVHKRDCKMRLELNGLAKIQKEPIRGFGHYKGHKPDVYSFQAVVADVEVSVETGEVRVQRLYFVYDAGRIINPVIHQGQIDSGVVQGLGYALSEELLLDDGRVTTASMGDYKIFTIRDVPSLTTSLVQAKVGPGPFGAKSVAEAGISIIAPAVVNAVYNATGVRIHEIPITSEKILRGLSCRSQVSESSSRR